MAYLAGWGLGKCCRIDMIWVWGCREKNQDPGMGIFGVGGSVVGEQLRKYTLRAGDKSK